MISIDLCNYVGHNKQHVPHLNATHEPKHVYEATIIANFSTSSLTLGISGLCWMAPRTILYQASAACFPLHKHHNKWYE